MQKAYDTILTYEELFSSLIPEFQLYWNSKSCLFNKGMDSTVHGIFTAFSHVACKKLESNSLENTSAIFELIEKAIKNGGSSENAACTCFLENILNRTPSIIKPEYYVSSLGEKSKEFCSAWNEFTGACIAGI